MTTDAVQPRQISEGGMFSHPIESLDSRKLGKLIVPEVAFFLVEHVFPARNLDQWVEAALPLQGKGHFLVETRRLQTDLLISQEKWLPFLETAGEILDSHSKSAKSATG